MFTAILASATLASAVATAPAAGVQTRVIRILDQTLTAQPIELPVGPVRVTVSEMSLPVGARLPRHRHPFARYVHVLAGRLAVKDLTTGVVVELGPKDWAVDIVEAWHEGQALGEEPVRLLLIEQAPAGAATTVLGDMPPVPAAGHP
jgi:quercetin dioxygenase-like cupin family protein